MHRAHGNSTQLSQVHDSTALVTLAIVLVRWQAMAPIASQEWRSLIRNKATIPASRLRMLHIWASDVALKYLAPTLASVVFPARVHDAAVSSKDRAAMTAAPREQMIQIILGAAEIPQGATIEPAFATCTWQLDLTPARVAFECVAFGLSTAALVPRAAEIPGGKALAPVDGDVPHVFERRFTCGQRIVG